MNFFFRVCVMSWILLRKPGMSRSQEAKKELATGLNWEATEVVSVFLYWACLVLGKTTLSSFYLWSRLKSPCFVNLKTFVGDRGLEDRTTHHKRASDWFSFPNKNSQPLVVQLFQSKILCLPAILTGSYLKPVFSVLLLPPKGKPFPKSPDDPTMRPDPTCRKTRCRSARCLVATIRSAGYKGMVEVGDGWKPPFFMWLSFSNGFYGIFKDFLAHDFSIPLALLKDLHFFEC